MAFWRDWNSVRNLKNYVLIFKKNKSFFWWVSTDVVLRSYWVDERWQQKKNRDLSKSRERWENFMELNLTKDQEKRIRWVNNIQPKDVQVILDVVYDSLAAWQWYDVVKKTILATKDEISYNPIFIALLESWSNVRSIIDLVEFPFKSEITEILNSSDNELTKYKKIEKILYFKEVQDWIKWVFKKQWAKIWWYMAALTIILLWIKLLLFPVIEEKLVTWFWFDRDTMLWDSLFMLWIFEKLIFWLLWVAAFALLLYAVNKERFYQIIYKIPMINEILQYWNTLKLLMTYSFNYTYSTKFRQKTFEITNEYFALKEDNNLQAIWEIINYNYQKIKDKFWIKFYDPLVSVTLWTIWEWWSDTVETVVNKKIDNYIAKMKDRQDAFEWILTTVTLILVAWMVFIMIGSIIIISFNAMNAVN